MKIGIIGTGNVGSALTKSLSKVGHEVILGVRDKNSEKVKNLLGFNENVKSTSIENMVKETEIIIIAAVPQSAKEIAEKLGNVKDKVIIDAMNSIRFKPEPFENTTEAFMEWTNCENVVKCFNTTGAENMENPFYDGEGIDMFVAGDSQKGKNIAIKLSQDIGFKECYDFGGKDKFQLMEQFAMSWINLAIMQKYGRNIAFKIIKR